MSEPTWVLAQTVVSLHEESLALFGGLAGIRDQAMLDSALARPVNAWSFGNPTVTELAASYAFGLAKNHPFHDGNKRIAFVTAIVFLEANGKQFTGTEVDAVLKTLALAAGELDEAGYAEWLKANTN